MAKRVLVGVLRCLALETAVPVVLLAATGVLYLVRSDTQGLGPPIPDALPLDELSRHDATSLVAFLVVWASAALLLGLVARSLRFERTTAAVTLALSIGLWLYLVDGASLFVVRQVAASDAFHAARHVRPLYVAAGLAGLAGALLGRPRASSSRSRPTRLAILVAVAGLVDVASAITPEIGERLQMVENLVPSALPEVASALAVATGLALVVVAGGLRRRKHRAWQLAVLLLAGSAVLNILKGLDYEEASLTGLLALALVARRRDFDVTGEPGGLARVGGKAFVYVAGIYAYGAVALWTNRSLADRPYSVTFAVRETTVAALGLSVRGSSHVAGRFGWWFPLSVLVLVIVAGFALLLAWLRPWRYRLRQEARERDLVRSLVGTWGSDTLSPFALRADKSYFFTEDERAFLAYRVVNGVAIVSGDPVGPSESFDELLVSFIAFARARDWRIAILGASERNLDLYRCHGLQSLYHGDEAVVETARFSLDGRAIRKVRQSVHRLVKAGYTTQIAYPAEIDPELRATLEGIAHAWRGSEPQRGFVMALDALFRLDSDAAVFVIGRDASATPTGFLHFAVSQAGSALSLSSMPRLSTTPNGFNEWLICEAIAWARGQGFERISLNFAPFAALFAPDAKLSRARRVERLALRGLKGHFQLDNLLTFNRKFFPSWQKRFVVYESWLDLPRVCLAALAAEAYLPFTGRRSS